MSDDLIKSIWGDLDPSMYGSIAMPLTYRRFGPDDAPLTVIKLPDDVIIKRLEPRGKYIWAFTECGKEYRVDVDRKEAVRADLRRAK